MIIDENILKELYANGCDIKKDEPMKNHTNFRIGGETPYMFFPRTKSSFIYTLRTLKEKNIEYRVIGGGANLIVKDEKLDFVVISTKNLSNISLRNEDIIKYLLMENTELMDIGFKDEEIYAETGVPISRVSNWASEEKLSGLEFASGIPGTVGGAIFMNAGAYEGEIKDVVKSVEIYDEKNDRVEILSNENLDFSYRHSIIQDKNFIVLSVIFKLEKKSKDEILNKIRELSNKRWNKQPLDMPSAGSIFKRPRNDFYVGTTIEKLGLKGFSLGDAMISEKHGGFIVNKGNASFKEVMDLILEVKKIVKEKYNTDLEVEPEIWN
ncbi:MAG: UDP-N-acetylmuramate dehydrogenase [Thermotogota bacterium]